jgi:hypothetical protein
VAACSGFARRLLALALICASTAGYAASSPLSPQTLAYCTKLYGLWYRYGNHPTFHHTGQRARAELALYRCQNGDYDPGIGELKVILARNRLATPPTPSALAEEPASEAATGSAREQ